MCVCDAHATEKERGNESLCKIEEVGEKQHKANAASIEQDVN